MINYILLGGSLLSAIGRNVFSKLGGDRFSGLSSMLGTNIFTAVLALVIFGITLPDFSLITPELVLFAAVYSIFSMLSPCLHIAALERGSISVCSLIYGCAFLLPTVFGTFFRGDTPTATAIIGIILVLFAIALTTGKPGKGGSYIFISIAAMIASGGVGICQTIFSNTYDHSYQNELLFVAFTLNLIISCTMLLLLKAKKTARPIRIDRRYFVCALMLAVCVVGQNRINLDLSGKLPSVVMFPVASGGGIAATTLLSGVMFGDKLQPRQIAGICVAVAAIVLIFI